MVGVSGNGVELTNVTFLKKVTLVNEGKPAANDFGGPGMSAREACAQVLLCRNEFLFVD